ncbi:hypothetical protein [Brevundimonas sp.]|jgi:hypothetical protein|uniref:hypothetical protein n=1 Tax=Brevundimonas sp. TaxID=1871086 RepID=UPI003784D4E7
MERTLSEKEIEAITNFGAFGYDASRMASILGWREDEVVKLLSSPSEFAKLVQKGKDMAGYAIDQKLWSMALSGDMKALEKFEQRKQARSMKKKV